MTRNTAQPVLTSGDVSLRRVTHDDVADRFALGRSAEILKGYGVDAAEMGPYTHDDAKAWVAAHVDKDHAFAIDHRGALTGVVFLHSLDETDKRAILAVGLLDEAKLDQGIGEAAIRLILGYAFDTLGLHRVALRVLDDNARAIACYRKLGFVEEGRLRENALVAGRWQDDIMMGLLASEFPA
ncbi:GNAT family N-acetyltransferase [Pseudooctadecabacter jejudonensis]|uniref:Putative ribosomal N-acetyltransferase YdaF n=1 Tax=Pseudooctadecabacter jejudonensis TaxID=1391910 RepID=A0A1Y5RDM8_9RHOB|nr:GNAT family protein [Pseudooctadecabacter jejudonensis]SLN15062.1 Putative ribosomal N-acetyltransferase YdaF [Pseudooctadecabacter jejudonensis]